MCGSILMSGAFYQLAVLNVQFCFSPFDRSPSLGYKQYVMMSNELSCFMIWCSDYLSVCRFSQRLII
jgi:hypothetical protein